LNEYIILVIGKDIVVDSFEPHLIKRIVKSKKKFFYDTGVYARL